MCTRVREQTLQHARQGSTLDYSSIEWQQLMLVSFVQAVFFFFFFSIKVYAKCKGYIQ